ncbi:uncharacterized protein LOC131610206 isoform X2 [Vicia villosa]|uniref:uncharacterized protein LOC131610206 isoform X2 n=1 Tax=Vicia villosa TaxID=3911 RepID=UPI00273AE83F|nr:uncharacterized protein LOC131610206 isoform X2 [Vicia villosa]
MDASVKPESESRTGLLDQEMPAVNGCIVYTRGKRSLNPCNGFSEDVDCKRFREDAETPIELENGVDCCTGSRDDGECGDAMKSEVREVAETAVKRITRSAMKAEVESSKVPVRSFKRITRSAMKTKVESDGKTVNVLEQSGAAVGAVPVRNLKRFTRSAMKEKVESREETVNVVEQQGAADVSGKGDCVVPVRNSKRLTRSAMKEKAESREETVNVVEQLGAADVSGKGNGVVQVRNSKRFTRSAVKEKAESCEETVTVVKQQGDAVVSGKSNGAVPVRNLKRFTRSAMKEKGESYEETLAVVKQQDAAVVSGKGNDGHVVPVRNLKRFTRSAMKEKAESCEETLNVVEQQGAAVVSGKDNGTVGMFKRFTRSAGKVTAESGEETVTELEQQGAAVASGEGSVRMFKRITRSASMKANPESGEETVTKLEKKRAAVVGNINGVLAAPRNKMELKMSKKIVVNKKPTTVKELLHTGLLDGISVVYVGGLKKALGLKGVISNGGILCSCCLCKGSRVIPPSQFEIHACKQYKRAVEYICLENGKSLLDLLRACRRAPLHDLEATIQNFVRSPPEEKYFTCKRCKGCLPSSCMERAGPICSSCAESCKPEESSKNVVGKRVRSSKRDNSSNSSKSASVPILPQKKITLKTKKNVITRSLSVKLKTTSNCLSKSQLKITKKDFRLHKLVFEENGLPDGTEVAYYAGGQKLLEGFKMGSGILCRCCNTEISPSQFEVHAGWASRKKPYAYIYTSNGVSLHELSISLSKDRKYSAKDNDDLCVVCWDGGNLLLCDGCPRAFHKECASISSIPRGDWYCQFCQNMFQREKFVAYNNNAFAAGRVEGVDPIEQITKRCIRIVKDIDAELSGCALCRGVDFSRSGFGPRTIILCDQCEKEYHVGCLGDHKMAFLKELPKGNWLCSDDCKRIHSTLENVLVRGAERLPQSLLSVIEKKHGEKGLDPINDINVSWRLLSGKNASPETRPLLLEAVSIFHQCFDPIVDEASGRDLIRAMVYGKSVRGQEFRGMHCALLIVNSSVVSAGMLRIFGTDIAELPLVATSNSHHGKGYFQALFSCIERLLAFMKVKNLVLPAAEEALSIWTDKFGFSKIKPDELASYRRNCNQFVNFKGTNMLHKMVPPCRIINNQPPQIFIEKKSIMEAETS